MVNFFIIFYLVYRCKFWDLSFVLKSKNIKIKIKVENSLDHNILKTPKKNSSKNVNL